MLDIKKLYEPYSRHCSLENMLDWIRKDAAKDGISQVIVENAVTEVFLEMANGLKFSTKHQHHTVDHANLNLYIKKRIFDLHRKTTTEVQGILDSRIKNLVETQMKLISKTDKEYIKMNQPPITERSPILRYLYKLYNKIKGA